MKKHFISLFDSAHLKWTISLFTIAALLIIAASFTGISDNLPGIALLYGGILFLFFSVLHPWKNPRNYWTLLILCLVILFLEWLGITILDRLNKTEYISEGIAMGVAFLICMPGIVVGIMGGFICTFRKSFWQDKSSQSE
jgi:hypothetical protein